MKIFIHLSCIILITFKYCFAQKIALSEQGKQFPLYSTIDTNKVKFYLQYMRFGNYDSLKILEYRTYLKPLAQNQDALAQFLYAEAHDLFPLGKGSQDDARIALEYYHKAANQNLVIAEEFLYEVYRYQLMHAPKDYTKSLYYLNQMILHGNDFFKVKGYKKLAGLHQSGDFEAIPQDQEKAIFYLEKVLEISPNDTWALDFLGSLYAKKGDYKQAEKVLLNSDNIQSHLKVAEWLIFGKKLPKDLARGVKIMREKAAVIKSKYDNIYDYMASINPIHRLNELYCQEIITKEQLGEFIQETYQKYHCEKK